MSYTDPPALNSHPPDPGLVLQNEWRCGDLEVAELDLRRSPIINEPSPWIVIFFPKMLGLDPQGGIRSQNMRFDLLFVHPARNRKKPCFWGGAEKLPAFRSSMDNTAVPSSGYTPHIALKTRHESVNIWAN